MALTTEKDIGAPRTINTVQRKRKVICVSMDHEEGVYGLTIIYREYEIDGSGNVVSSNDLVKKVADANLGAQAKAEIDNIFTRALAAI